MTTSASEASRLAQHIGEHFITTLRSAGVTHPIKLVGLRDILLPALEAAERRGGVGAWSDDMSAAPKGVMIDIIAGGRIYCGCYYCLARNEWRSLLPGDYLWSCRGALVTHWRLPPALPVAE